MDSYQRNCGILILLKKILEGEGKPLAQPLCIFSIRLS